MTTDDDAMLDGDKIVEAMQSMHENSRWLDLALAAPNDGGRESAMHIDGRMEAMEPSHKR